MPAGEQGQGKQAAHELERAKEVHLTRVQIKLLLFLAALGSYKTAVMSSLSNHARMPAWRHGRYRWAQQSAQTRPSLRLTPH